MSPKTSLRSYLHSFVDLLFPNICMACSTALSGNERSVCTKCLSALPFTNFWNHRHNPVSEVFWGRVDVQAAASLVFFEKGSGLQQMLFALKYKSKPEVGVVLGRYLGHKLVGSPFENVDLIIPVPLHQTRYRERGFNQSERIAAGIGQSLKKPVSDELVRRAKATKTQTSKNRYDRWLNVEGVFEIPDTLPLIEKHILVVDDVVTTGATSESLIQELLKVPGVKVSFVAVAHA